MALIYCDGDTPLAEAYAKEAAEALVATYPNHSWWVECKQGVLIIKHFEASGMRGHIGMARHTSQLDGDAGFRKRDTIRAAGELLERANLRRGPRGEEPVERLELDKNLAKHWHRPNHIKVIN